MTPLIHLKATAALLNRVDVDTDAIIPKQFLKKIERTGFGKHLFHDWRFLDDEGEVPNPEFELNEPRYQGAKILVTRDNFGCGSSREHAPWALHDYGFRCILAPSFADIFYNNCFKNGILPIKLSNADIQQLFTEIESKEHAQVEVDLREQTVLTPEGNLFSFDVDSFAKEKLLKGLDEIGWTLQFLEHIEQFEKNSLCQTPWNDLNH